VGEILLDLVKKVTLTPLRAQEVHYGEENMVTAGLAGILSCKGIEIWEGSSL